MTEPTAHVLALDDDPEVRRLVAEYLSQNDLRVTAVATGAELAEAMAHHAIDLVVLDLRLQGEDGLQIARKLREASGIPILMLTGRAEDALIGERLTTLLDDPAEAPSDAVWRAQVLRGESFGRRKFRRPDGSTRVVDFAMRASRAGGTVLVLGVCVRDHGGARSQRAHEPAPLSTREFSGVSDSHERR